MILDESVHPYYPELADFPLLYPTYMIAPDLEEKRSHMRQLLD